MSFLFCCKVFILATEILNITDYIYQYLKVVQFMKITANTSINAAKIYSKNSLKNTNENIKDSKKYDSIEISKEGGKIAKYVSYANDIIDVRQKKVEELKSKIKAGRYNVSSEDLASEILKAIKEERESI